MLYPGQRPLLFLGRPPDFPLDRRVGHGDEMPGLQIGPRRRGTRRPDAVLDDLPGDGPRGVEERGHILYRQGKIPGSFYTGRGNEAASVGVATAMGPDDVGTPLQRDMGVHVTRGLEPWRIFAQYMGREDGPTRGRDGNVHIVKIVYNAGQLTVFLDDFGAPALSTAVDSPCPLTLS